MFQRFHAMKEREEGFTLIELLVVILIIAILAAVAIPVFLRQREKGWKAQQESALKNAATAAESYATGNNGSYANLDLGDLTANGFVANNTTNIAIVAAQTSATAYCLSATHTSLTTGEWAVASYDSDEGQPESDDDCTA